ncbi:VIT domain-containing protein [Piscinibacter sp.]|uniref:VIT domain-containing protein n=1 Tax=Piscinibacter sp. TaxID=1903157 RepID=UPI002589F27D|nr:VIT domain-containing protein [Piscinibacter sp.]
MNLSRRSMLHAGAGAALLGLSAPLAAQSANDPTPLVPRPPRLRVQGAEQPVRLRSVRIDTEIAARTALTRIEFEFVNPNPRVLEGELEFPLLEGQTVVGMAMEIDGALREAVPVEKARGEQVFEDVTRTRIDPALLSATQGGNHKLRVYPLPAQGRKRVVIRHAQALEPRGGSLHWRLPLDFGERLEQLVVALRVEGAGAAPRASARGQPLPGFERRGNGHAFDWSQQDVAALPLLELELDTPREPAVASGRRDGRAYVLAQLPVAVQRRPRPLPRSVALVWDASGSGAERDHGREFALLDAYFAAAGDIDVRLVLLRDAAEPVQRFRVEGGRWDGLRRALEATVYDGATNLGALPALPGVGEWLLFSDGLANYGGTERPATPVPVYTVSAALRSDPARLRGLAERSGGRHLDLLALRPEEARARLLERSTRLLRLSSNAATRLVADSPWPDDGWLTVAGELSEAQGRLRIALEHPDGAREDLELPLAAGDGALAPLAWARLQIAALQADAALNRAEIRRLSQAFSIVGPETSLLILDRPEDYVRHDIPAPPELAQAVAALRVQAQQRLAAGRSAQLEQVVRAFAAKQQWWEREFPQERRKRAPRDEAESALELHDAVPGRPPAAPAPLRSMAPLMRESQALAAGAAAPAARQAKSAAGPAQAAERNVIRLQPAVPNAAWARRLRAARPEQLYRVYLDERPGQLRSTAFFLDAAQLLFERGQHELALRVLSNLAEMELENRHVLRILAQRLLQAGQPKLAVPLLERVRELAPHEPQSHRDLGLALAADGQTQAAIDALHEVAQQPWPRFPEIELIALAELNAIAAAAGARVDTSRIDRRLLRNLPLDLRVVLAWDSDNTDIDLWVTDPDGDAAHYARPLTHQGGRMSRDATGGYGPEEFSLRRARPGRYRVEAQFYGHTQQVVSSATTISLWLSTGFGTPHQRDQRITLRLAEPKERVFVGEFEVGVG